MRRNIYSATKSFTSCAVGFAIQEGLLSLDEKLTEAFPKDLPEQVSDHLARATVRDLLTMCLGEKEPQLMGEQRPLYTEDDWVKMCLAFPLVNEPGTQFLYSNVGPYLAGVLVQRRAGCDLASYLTPRLFDHLGIRRPTWEIDPQGYSFGAGGLFLTLSELHTFGLFCLHKGKWNGRQLLSADWIEECAKKQGPGPYGYLFWRGEYNSFRADGKFCQLSIIFPDKNAVISMVSECRDSDTLMKAIYEELCPQL
ncbi:MAG: serine hydrolase [Clostridiales bacterium]|nr:serine hydrolase [Clostridiales bacterium]